MKKLMVIVLMLVFANCTKNDELLNECECYKTTYFYTIDNNDVSTIKTYIISKELVECQDAVYKVPTNQANVYYSIGCTY